MPFGKLQAASPRYAVLRDAAVVVTVSRANCGREHLEYAGAGRTARSSPLGIYAILAAAPTGKLLP
jgi:hypothetical protein